MRMSNYSSTLCFPNMYVWKKSLGIEMIIPLYLVNYSFFKTQVRYPLD